MRWDLNGFRVAPLADDHRRPGFSKSPCGLDATLQLSVQSPSTACHTRFHRKSIFLFRQTKKIASPSLKRAERRESPFCFFFFFCKLRSHPCSDESASQGMGTILLGVCPTWLGSRTLACQHNGSLTCLLGCLPSLGPLHRHCIALHNHRDCFLGESKKVHLASREGTSCFTLLCSAWHSFSLVLLYFSPGIRGESRSWDLGSLPEARQDLGVGK